MLELLATTLINLFTTSAFLYLMLGVAVGLVIGILPALGTTAGMALLVPFVFGMDPTAAIAMMTGLLAVVATGDTVTSVLLGIPGGPASQVTVIDGFPMAKRGEAARALSAAYLSSLVGGVIGAIVLTGAILVARPVVLAFGMGELLMLGILGITMVSVLSGPSLIKGFVACGLGMLLGAVGTAPATSEERLLVGDFFYLVDGLPLAVVALAIFAIPEIIDLLRRDQAVAGSASMGKGRIQGLIDVLNNKWLVVRCSLIGCLIGALPIGASSWIAYGHAVQTCKPRDRFGKGDVRGVIAPEAANNAADGGSLIPALIFGIPGSGSSAVFLGGLILLGVQPGPAMVGSNLDLTYTIIWSFAIANIFGAGICLLLSGYMAWLTKVRFAYLAPYLLTVVFFGAFQATRAWGDFVSLFIIGFFAVFLRRFGYSRPAFLIGFVLQNTLETLLYQTIQLYSLTQLFSRPLMWVLVAIVLGSLIFGLRNRPVIESEGRSGQMTASQLRPQIIFTMFTMGVAAFALYDVNDLDFTGKVFPSTVALFTLAFSIVGLGALLARRLQSPMLFDSEISWREREEGYKTNLYYYLIWIAGFMAAIYTVGFILAVFLFFIVFLRAKAEANWPVTIAMTCSAISLLSLISHFFVIKFPTGLLQSVVTLPWPIG